MWTFRKPEKSEHGIYILDITDTHKREISGTSSKTWRGQRTSRCRSRIHVHTPLLGAELPQSFIPPRDLHPLALRYPFHGPIALRSSSLLSPHFPISRYQPRQVSSPSLSHTHHVHMMPLHHAFGGIQAQPRPCEVGRTVFFNEKAVAERETGVATQEGVNAGCAGGCGGAAVERGGADAGGW